jgi:hypothetical protein
MPAQTKGPIANLEAEQSVLGAILVPPCLLYEVANLVNPLINAGNTPHELVSSL